MKVFEANPVTGCNARKSGAPPEAAGAQMPSTGNALVAIEPPVRLLPPRLSLARPEASFVAHLIATAAQTPQTRVLRRATSADALATYGQTTKAREPALTPREGSRLTRIA